MAVWACASLGSVLGCPGQHCGILQGKEYGSRNSDFVPKERRKDGGPPGPIPVVEGF